MNIIPLQDNKEDSKGFQLVELEEGAGRLTPHCKIHGAMNKMCERDIWRCLSEYGRREVQEGETIGKFQDRTCPACCIELSELSPNTKREDKLNGK